MPREPRQHLHVPKIFQGIPELPKFNYPGPIKKALKDINYLKDLSTIPCGEASWMVIAQTGLNTGLPALLTLALPGCNDIVKAKLGLSPWHARGVKSLLRGAAPPLALTGTKFLWKIGYFTAEKYLWFFQVADVTKEWFITWQSQVYMQQQCQLPAAGSAYGYFPAFVYGTAGPQPLSIAPIKNCPGCIISGDVIQIDPGFQASIGWSVNWDTYPIRGGGVNVNTWTVETAIPGFTNFMGTNDPNKRNGNQTGGHAYIQNDTHSEGLRIAFFMENLGSNNVQPISTTWTVSTQGRHSGLYSFGCLPKTVKWPFHG